MPLNPSLRIASRQSPLAVRQANMIRSKLAYEIGVSETEFQEHLRVKTFVTQGDLRLSGSLADIGGKGLFTKEIEHALLDNKADIAVHSMKDMPAELPKGLVIAAIPAREDPRDAFISEMAPTPWELPENAVFGTSSVRRAAQLLNKRPDLRIVPLRGNVDSRLQKLNAGQADATLLAEAGLRRLDKADVKRTILDTEEMLPAVGQGILCVQMRAEDPAVELVHKALACEKTTIISAVERSFLKRLDGSCQTPIAGLAEILGQELNFRAQFLSLDGAMSVSIARSWNLSKNQEMRVQLSEAEAFGIALADEIYEAAPAKIQALIKKI